MKIKNRNKNNLISFISVLIICLLIPILIRFIELPKWQNKAYEINGEKLMATHDAYYYMASAIKTSRNPNEPLGIITRYISRTTNIPIGKMAFYIPGIFCSLLAIPLVILGYKNDVLEGSIVASILGSCCLGYLGRSRLGFFDTDFGVLALFVAFCCSIIIWLENRQKSQIPQHLSNFKLPILIGLIGYCYIWFYGSGKSLVLFSILLSTISLMILNHTERLSIFDSICGIIVIYIFTFGILSGIGTIFLLGSYRKIAKSVDNKIEWLILILGGVAASIEGSVHMIVYGGVIKFLNYAKILPHYISSSKTYSLQLPSVLQSIKEAQNLKFSEAVIRMSYNWPTFIIGVLGLIYLVIKKPSHLLFLLFLLLGILSIKLGNRFAMYGGIAIGVGLGFGIGLMFKNLLSKTGRWLFQIVLSILVLIPIVQISFKFTPSPIFPKIYAKTFVEASKIVPRNGRLWQWWDYGYACQYYAKRPSFADGGIHDGPFLYPLALVHTSNSPLLASNLIKYITKSQVMEYNKNKEKYDKNAKDVSLIWKIYLTDPISQLDKLGSKKAQRFLNNLKEKKLNITNIPPQYLVFSWENLKLAYWISYFGTWDIVTGTPFPGKIQSLHGKISINIGDGILIANNKKIKLDGLIIVDGKGKTHEYRWSSGSDIYGILNNISKEFYIMDSTIYFSNMIQMLLKDPSPFKPHFRLLVDHCPWTRVYKVK
ncbi:hypothetical protein [Desulfothermus sp.]